MERTNAKTSATEIAHHIVAGSQRKETAGRINSQIPDNHCTVMQRGFIEENVFQQRRCNFRINNFAGLDIISELCGIFNGYVGHYRRFPA